MALSDPRYKILPLRGTYAALSAEVANISEGEICYATDEDQYYQKEGGALVSVGATKAQGALADSAVQPGDNVSTLTNDAGYITSADGGNAQTLDGLDSSQFLRSDADDAFTGLITNNGILDCFVNSNSPGNRTRFGRDGTQYITFHGGSTGNFLTSVSGSGNPKPNIYFGVSTDGGTSLASQYSLGGVSGNIWHSGNDGSGSGLDADTLDGAQPSVIASNNTIVQRNSGGYIYASYFNTTPDDVSSGVTKVLVETGDDGFMRHGTQAAIRTFIGAGSGNGLDADTLDTLHSTSFLRSDSDSTFDGSVSGRYLSFNCVDGQDANSSSGNLFPLQIYQTSTTGDAAMAFHISGKYATYFGLDQSTNDLFVGGWSNGAVKHKIWHAGNDGSNSGLDADTLDGLHANSSSGNRFNVIPSVGSDGVMEIGRYIDFHATGGSTADFSVRLDGGTSNQLLLDGNKIWHAGNDGDGSGLDADLLDGQHRSEASVAATVVSRTIDADINCRLLRSEYQNQSTISGAIAFRVNDSNDNYTRYCNSPAAVRAWLMPTSGTDQVGSYAFLKKVTAGSASNGDSVPGPDLRYSSAAGNSLNTPTGTWKCMGRSRDGGTQVGEEMTTLYLKIA